MSQAFVREGGGRPQIWQSREAAESGAAIQKAMEGDRFDYEIRPRERGGFMVARLRKDGTFESFVEE